MPERSKPLGWPLVAGWLAGFALYMLLLVGAIVLLVQAGQLGSLPWKTLASPRVLLEARTRLEPILSDPAFQTAAAKAAALLIMAAYVSAACLLLPMPTHWIVSLLAVQALAPTQSFWQTTLLVAGVAALAAAIASVNDYLIFYWIYRHRASRWFRRTRLYEFSQRHFSRQPFLLLGFFSTVPVATFAVRMLSAGQGYPLWRYAAANFLGRFVLYAFIAGATFELGNKGWLAAVGLLALACVAALARGAAKLVKVLGWAHPGGKGDNP
jgi:membrane protein YqaA with SNARE-associated domain